MEQQLQGTKFNSQPAKKSEKMAFGILAIIMGILSLVCCCCVGLGIIPAILGVIFGLIALLKGTGSARITGIIGLVLSGVGLIISIYLLVAFGTHLNWENLTLENLKAIQNIDTNNKEEVIQWLQQFFKDVDFSTYY